ncbi:GNAT family N-acetyltransferase [Pelagibacteraceae bacterium]|nr:GNAT family N-acetyltransferase [Pelagibacteraceae bacterium]
MSKHFFCSSLSKIKSSEWNECVGNDHPFTQYEFLYALEKSNSANTKTGWQPYHYVEQENGKIISLCPLYIKNHSFGEYIFDHSWADAYHRYGINYYPKLQSAIPFTPVTGDRIILNKSIKNKRGKQTEVINNIIEEAKKINVSSLHFNFVNNASKWNNIDNIMVRSGIQFHWNNNEYKNFDEFLNNLSSRKRKIIRRERQCIENNNLTVKLLNGDDIKEEHINFFYDCYLDTTGKKWGSTYLTKEFFYEILNNFKKKILLIMAYQENKMIASAINFLSKTHLYGRLWGSKYEVPFLHFELCYYQAIEYAIQNNIQIVEAGAQGEHKLQRGYEPTKTWSAHWIKDQEFSKAIQSFLDNESQLIDNQKEKLKDYLPFKN